MKFFLCAIPTENILVKADERTRSSLVAILSSSDIFLPTPPSTGIHSFPAQYPSETPSPQRPFALELAPWEQSGLAAKVVVLA